MSKERDPRVVKIAEKLAEVQPYGFDFRKKIPSAADYHAALIAVKSLDEDVEYEYAMQLTFGDTPRRIENWTTKKIAEDKLKWHGDGNKSHGDPVWGPWTAKIVKRRKAGQVEDA